MSKFKNTTSIWPAINSNIHWQKHYRNSDSDSFSPTQDRFHTINEGINMSNILNSASIVEGYLEEKVRTIYLSENDQFIRTNFVKRQQDKFISELGKASFYKYKDHYETVVGKRLNDLIGTGNQKLWDDIVYLFELRNVIAHSESLQMTIDPNEGTQKQADVQFKGKFDNILKHLKDRNLTPLSFPVGTLFIKRFFSDEIANHFFEKAIGFITILDNELEKLGNWQTYNLRTLLSFELE